MRHPRRTCATALTLGLLTAACGGSTPSRPDTLTDVASNTIVPIYQQLAEGAQVLEQSLIELCANPQATNMAASHRALAVARMTWSTSEAMWVGPTMERRSWAVIDWPIDAADIEALIADTTIVLDNERLSRRIGADQRGLGAIEYILGDPTHAITTLDALQDPRRCGYLTGIAKVVSDEADLLPDDWTSDFEDAGPWSATLANPDTAGLDIIVNEALFLLEAVADRELGTALGSMGGDADADAIVEGPAGLGVSDIGAHLLGLRAIFVGDPDSEHRGLAPLLGDDLTDRLALAFDNADVSLAVIEGPLVTAIASEPDAVSATRDAIKEIQTLVATEVVSRLGVTIGFSDADGDTGS